MYICTNTLCLLMRGSDCACMCLIVTCNAAYASLVWLLSFLVCRVSETFWHIGADLGSGFRGLHPPSPHIILSRPTHLQTRLGLVTAASSSKSTVLLSGEPMPTGYISSAWFNLVVYRPELALDMRWARVYCVAGRGYNIITPNHIKDVN